MFERLKKRRDFLAAARGSKVARGAFVLESRHRGDDRPARFGFTVSKRMSKKAVERNRIRRRLREAARLFGSGHAQAGFDYVLVGRRTALTGDFARIAAELGEALAAKPASGAPRPRWRSQRSS